MFRQTRLMVLTTSLVALCLTAPAASATVLWTLSGATFSDGTTASGSFVFNADTVQFGSINITTTAGSVYGAETYLFSAPCCSNANQVEFITTNAANQTGLPSLFLTFHSTPLTDAGGTTATLDGEEDTCENAKCNFIMAPFLGVTAGQLTAAVASPEPGTLVPLGTGLFLVLRRGRGRMKSNTLLYGGRRRRFRINQLAGHVAQKTLYETGRGL